MSLYAGISMSDRLSRSPNIMDRAIGCFFQSIERRFGSIFVGTESHQELELLFAIARRLEHSGIVRSFGRRTSALPDEPHLFAWNAAYSDDDSAAGASATSDTQALASTLAESLERYLWRYDELPLTDSYATSERDIAASRKRYIPLERFTGFTESQRRNEKALQYSSDTIYAWSKGWDHISGSRVYIPLQTFTAVHTEHTHREPLVRPVITTGLATGVTREDALTGGALEIIERDAFMIMWLNQLTYPRIDLTELARTHDELRTLLERVTRYSLTIHAIRMATDAPAHAVLAVVEDEGSRPQAPFIVGMGCRQSLPDAAAHAILEALRIRMNARTHYARLDAASIVPRKIRHTERVPYWLHAERWHRLRFLTSGPIMHTPRADWEGDSRAGYLKRLKQWCIEKHYSFISYDLGRSKNNPTPWFVESVVIPELQPMHIVERYQCLGGQRLTEIPRMFGYTPRAEPFSEEPHPFA